MLDGVELTVQQASQPSIKNSCFEWNGWIELFLLAGRGAERDSHPRLDGMDRAARSLLYTFSNFIGIFIFMQKIRTIELEGKTVKLQIVSITNDKSCIPSPAVSATLESEMSTFTFSREWCCFFCATIQLSIDFCVSSSLLISLFNLAVGHGWSRTLQNHHFKLLQRSTWNYCCI